MPPTPAPSAVRSTWRARLTGPAAAAVVLGLFWLLLTASVGRKSVTYDETLHAAAGYSYWRYNDYRMQPENGNLPQRVAALGLLGLETRFPPTDGAAWTLADQWRVADQWFHRLGNDPAVLLQRGRAVSALFAVALAALVWTWSRRLFGPEGGMLSLLLCVLNPSILANGPLITSDTAAALFFLAATGAWWALLQRLTAGRLLLSTLATAGLFVAKMSAVLIIPIALVLAAARLARREPLPLGDRGRLLVRRRHQASALAAAVVLHAAVVFATLWASYGFRFSMFSPDLPGPHPGAEMWRDLAGRKSLPEALREIGLDPENHSAVRAVLDARSVPGFGWNQLSDEALAELRAKRVLAPDQAERLAAVVAADRPAATTRLILALRDRAILPEAFLYGYLHTWRFAQARSAYFNGRFSSYGWTSFFPYTFLVKTPLATFALAALALAAGVAAWRRPAPGDGGRTFGWATLPLWTLLALYWAAVLTSNLNIGHRHILATYPPLLILCGGAAAWLTGGLPRARLAAGAVLALVALQGAEIAGRFPHYLAYFNGIVSPAEAHRQFSDSTLDWGQDLPGVQQYIAAHPGEGPFHLSYFGNGDPRSHGIAARLLPSNPGRFLEDQPPLLVRELPPGADQDELARLAGGLPAYDLIGVFSQPSRRAALFLKSAEQLRLSAGTYFVSATMLQSSWREPDEESYRSFREAVQPLLAASDPAARGRILGRMGPEQWTAAIDSFEKLRLVRLTSFLRRYEPDGNIGYSILIYRVTASDLAQALDGPAPFDPGFLGRRLREAAP